MGLEYIREFCKLAEIGNFTDAANELYISQSTLSRHIRAFEAELGIELFTRTGKSVEINDYGKRFLPYAKRILDVEKECTQAFFEELRKLNTSLTVGIFSLDKQFGLANLVFDFKEKHPEYSIGFIEDHSDTLRKRLSDGDCDIAIAPNADQNDETFESVTLYADSLVAILPVEHELAKSPSLSFDQLSREKFIIQDGESAENKLCLLAARNAGFEPVISRPNLSTKGLIRFVERGLGITVKPKLFSEGRNNSRIAVVDIEPKLNLYVNVIYRKDVPLTAPGKSFIKFVKDSLRQKN